MTKINRAQGLIFFSGLWVILLFSLDGCQGSGRESSDTLFREVPPSKSGVAFANLLQPDDSFNIIEYLYYYNGGGVAIGDVNNDSLPDLYFTANEGPNALYLNRGNLQFEDVTETAGVAGMDGWATGVTMADVNADGRLDIYVCRVGDYKGIQGHNELFINNGDGTFIESAAAYGLDFRGFSTQAAFFDYDLDGDLDCYLLNHSVHAAENYSEADIRNVPNKLAGDRLFENQAIAPPSPPKGGGRQADSRSDSNLTARPSAWNSPPSGGRGAAVYVDVTAKAGLYSSRIGYGLGVAVGDINGDGCPDLYISNDFHENDYLYYNNCDGTFREAVTNSIGHTSTFSMGSDVADFDNDGRLDLISLDMKPADEQVLKSSVGADPYNIYQFKLGYGYYFQYPRNMLQWNRGNLTGEGAAFSEIGQLTGVDATDWSWAPLFCDLDADGLKDLFISNGIWRRPNDLNYLRYSSNEQVQARASDQKLAEQMPTGQVANYAFRNTGALNFEQVSDAWGFDLVGCSNAAAYGDLDGDGDLDLVLNNLNRAASIYENRRNEQPGFHYLRLRLNGGPQNPYGIGARVSLEAGSRRQVQELYPTRGFQSAVEPVLTFGLDREDTVARLEIRWPSGDTTLLANVPANQLLTIDRNMEGEENAEQRKQAAGPFLFQPVAANAGLNFRHRENRYTDFDREMLLPHLLSTQGPRMATADVDGDGRTDVYLCGARGQPGALYRQTADGRFQPATLATGPAYEEVDAAFFDADGDGAPDLYIVSGGGEAEAPAGAMQDQLWLNDGTGNFRKAPDALPAYSANGACVTPLDFDSDGAMDLFVGARSVPGSYALIPSSALLRNDGAGRFTNVTAGVIPELERAGMVTDAALVQGESAQRLIVVGEWMPVTIFSIENGRWTKTEIPYSNGWWNTVHAADLDGDGEEDLLLGNLGLNADLKASLEQPVRLYVKDFDNNGQTDPVLTYYKQGKEYTYASLDELAKQMPDLRKRYTDYAVFSKETFDEVFPPETRKGAEERMAYTFASSLALNRGDGQFELQALPREAQLSPLFAFETVDANADGYTDVLAAGNFYGSRPSLGRYDASYGHLLLGRGDGSFKSLQPAESGLVLEGESRNIRLIYRGDKPPLLIVARNDAPAMVNQLKMLPANRERPDHKEMQ